MSVSKSKDVFRTKPWMSSTFKGSQRVKRFFATKEEALEFDAQQTLSPVSKKGWDKIKVSYLIERYRDNITPTKNGADYEAYRLNWMLNNEPGKTLCNYSLLNLVERVQAWQYIRARQRQTSVRGTPVTMRTISRERNLLQDVFRIAVEEWGYVGLPNPFRGLTLKGSKFKRTRRMTDKEKQKLIDAANTHARGFNRFFIPLAIEFALDTGMREQEIFNLRWKDIDINKRTIYIRKSKTDHMQQSPGRTIPLPFKTMFGLWLLIVVERRRPIFNDKMFLDSAPIFPMSQSAFIQAFDGVVKRAGLVDFEFRDIRREANSRWDDNEPPLTLTQRKTMLGQMGASGEINDVYSVSSLKKIREKLDRQSKYFQGQSFDEAFSKQIEGGWDNWKILMEYYLLLLKTEKAEKEGRTVEDIKDNELPPNVIPFKRAGEGA